MKQLRVKTKINRTMGCEEAELVIIDFLTRNHPTVVPEGLSDHMGRCESCNRLFNEMEAGFLALASGRRKVADPGFYNHVANKMKFQVNRGLEKSMRGSSILHLSPAILSAVASVLLGVWLGGRIFNKTQIDTVSEDKLTGQLISVLPESFTEDLQLIDESTLLIENYLTDNENYDYHGSE